MPRIKMYGVLSTTSAHASQAAAFAECSDGDLLVEILVDSDADKVLMIEKTWPVKLILQGLGEEERP
jgi:hypothetical protein